MLPQPLIQDATHHLLRRSLPPHDHPRQRRGAGRSEVSRFPPPPGLIPLAWQILLRRFPHRCWVPYRYCIPHRHRLPHRHGQLSSTCPVWLSYRRDASEPRLRQAFSLSKWPRLRAPSGLQTQRGRASMEKARQAPELEAHLPRSAHRSSPATHPGRVPHRERRFPGSDGESFRPPASLSPAHGLETGAGWSILMSNAKGGTRIVIMKREKCAGWDPSGRPGRCDEK